MLPITRFAVRRLAAVVGAATLCSGLASAPALAHPHASVEISGRVLFTDGAVSGFEQVWTFDEFHSASAVEGLDRNGDGKLDRAELADLAKANIEGLREFQFFTAITQGGRGLAMGDASDVWMDHDGRLLRLHLTVPLVTPAPVAAGQLSLQVADPTFFIAFQIRPETGVTLGPGAPPTCKFTTPTADVAEVAKPEMQAAKPNHEDDETPGAQRMAPKLTIECGRH